MDMSVQEVADLVGAKVIGDAEVRISGVNGIREASHGEIAFIRGSRYLPYLKTTGAAAVLLAEPVAACSIPQIIVAQPDMAFARLLQLCEIEMVSHPVGMHPTAVVGQNVELGRDVALGAHVCIADDVVIGDKVVLYAGVYIGHACIIGAGTILYPNVVVREETDIGARCIVHSGAVIGADGFGFAPLQGQWMKIPQVGRVIIEDDVEIGANTTIDRATFGRTRIGRGTKIDNLVQVGHNVEIGEHCVIAGEAGIAGSAIIGNHVRIGAQAGIGGHLDIGDGASIGGRAGVHKSIAAGMTVSGYPAMDHVQERRVLIAQKQLPGLIRRVRQLEKKLEQLEDAHDD